MSFCAQYAQTNDCDGLNLFSDYQHNICGILCTFVWRCEPCVWPKTLEWMSELSSETKESARERNRTWIEQNPHVDSGFSIKIFPMRSFAHVSISCFNVFQWMNRITCLKCAEKQRVNDEMWGKPSERYDISCVKDAF